MTYEDAITAEVERWPGCSVRFEQGGKHMRAVLIYAGRDKFVTYPASGSDSQRGPLNCVTNVRQTLTELGARRTPSRKSAKPRRKVNPGADLREIKRATEPAPTIADPWAALKEIKFAPPPKPSLWARLKRWLQSNPTGDL